MKEAGTLIFLCGKMGAGKSTTAQAVSQDLGAVLISEDQWLAGLYPGEIGSIQDYLAYSSRLKQVLAPHVSDLLDTGVSVVMDFPGNTREQRQWFKASFLGGGAAHRLIYLEASDALCLKRLAVRREQQPERAAFDTEAVFQRMSRHFEPPAPDEGFNVEIQRQGDGASNS